MTASVLSHRPADEASTTTLPGPYLLFLGDVVEAGYAKTAFGLRDWARDRCVGEFALPEAAITTGLPGVTPEEAAARGARAMVIGVASPGGTIPASWSGALHAALEAGLHLISGMHHRLGDLPGLAAAAERRGLRLIDVRTPPSDIAVASGVRRSGRRLLTVGTDCALGKKYTALALARAFGDRGVASAFRATGQTGIMIAGGGIPIDAVVSDFVAGAAEMLSPAAAADHWDIIEGQGSILHPSYAAVSLGLLHGSQPDVFVVCHDPTRTTILGHAPMPLPSIEAMIAQTVALGRVTNPDIRCAGVSLNTAGLDGARADVAIAAVAERLGVAAADPLRGGPTFERLVDACLE